MGVIRKIREQVLEAAALHAISLRELAPEEAQALRDAVYQRYTVRHDVVWIWADLKHAVSLQAEDGWSWMGEYAGAEPLILFFNSDKDLTMFELQNGYQLEPIIGDSYGFEFYCTNAAVDYLLCFNHHDYVIASGSAESWLARRKLDLERLEGDDLLGEAGAEV